MKKRPRKQINKLGLFGLGFALIIVALAAVGLNLKTKSHPEQVKKTSSSSIKNADSSVKREKVPSEKLSLAQEVGQLFMVGMPAADYNEATAYALRDLQVGNVILTGRSTLGVQMTKKLTTRLQDLAPEHRKLLIACDQEGGAVQVLQGEGFTAIPDGITQGTWQPQTLKSKASEWGSALAAAGVNFNLAPVADLVASAEFAPSNAPIGYWGRQYAYTPDEVVSHAKAFSDGMKEAQVLTTAKHFPGLGAVRGNTDTTANVQDTKTSLTSPSVKVFEQLIDKNISSIMTATAIYTQLDDKIPAAFSSQVVQGLLREKLKFKGLVITDDLSNAAQVQAWTPAQRASLALEAGNDMVLANDPAQLPEMVAHVIAKAESEPEFATKIHQAATRVLKIKQQMNLLE